MGLNKGDNAIYLSVANGKLVRQHKEPNANTVQRTTKTEKIVHEEFFKDLTGVITDISKRTNDYGTQYTVTFVDGDDVYKVQMPYSGRYSSSFIKALPNTDPKLEVRFMPWEMTDKNNAAKKVTGVTLYQCGEKIAPAFTKEDPNGLPEMKKIKVKGKEQWDDSEMCEFLERVAMEWIGIAKNISTIDAREEEAGDEPPF